MKSLAKFLTQEFAILFIDRLTWSGLHSFGSLLIVKELDGYFHVYDADEVIS
jgi:hypothetical protein